MTFSSTVLILPGLGNSGEQHWQTRWEKRYPDFIRVQQRDWDTPHCQDWIETLERKVMEYQPERVMLVAHSLACATVGYWAQRFQRVIRGALLVAPSDTEAETYPPGTSGFAPMPIQKLPFPSIVVASSNDFYVSPERARYFAQRWGSERVDIGEAGHINAASGLGDWSFGLELLQKLEQRNSL
jgi:uncharacterized protein